MKYGNEKFQGKICKKDIKGKDCVTKTKYFNILENPRDKIYNVSY